MNPKKYKADDIVNIHGNKVSAQEIWDHDQKRNSAIEESGIKIFVVWESDYKSNKEKCIKELVNEIKKYKNLN